MSKSNQSPLQRIKLVMKYYYDKDANSERCNKIYRKLIKK